MTVKLGGKDYVTVAERVEEALKTSAGYSMLSAETFSIGERWFYRVALLVGEGRQFIGTAEIKFNAPPNSADGKSPIECAETSAVGRALGFAGFGVIEGIASADEMQRGESHAPERPADRPVERPRDTRQPATAGAREAQDEPERIGANPAQLNAIAKLAAELGVALPEITSFEHAVNTIARLNTMKRERALARERTAG
jgi:hypothetical protein